MNVQTLKRFKPAAISRNFRKDEITDIVLFAMQEEEGHQTDEDDIKTVDYCAIFFLTTVLFLSVTFALFKTEILAFLLSGAA
ncbi:MAG: hypothetical protein GY757_13985 [bacterium]|nr:hypothetical protein [bacterium]